jgi:hypothetical protein
MIRRTSSTRAARGLGLFHIIKESQESHDSSHLFNEGGAGRGLCEVELAFGQRMRHAPPVRRRPQLQPAPPPLVIGSVVIGCRLLPPLLR